MKILHEAELNNLDDIDDDFTHGDTDFTKDDLDDTDLDDNNFGLSGTNSKNKQQQQQKVTASKVNKQYQSAKKNTTSNKAVSGQQVLKMAVSDIPPVNTPAQVADIEPALDQSLKAALMNRKTGSGEVPNVLLIGEAGTGKTSRVHAWAKENNINLRVLSAQTLDPTDLGGAVAPDKMNKYVHRLYNTELDTLDRPRSVLFLDEYNRAADWVRGTLLTLINDKKIPKSDEKSAEKYFKNLLFSIAAINPSATGYNTQELDPAEMTRFRVVYVEATAEMWLGWYVNKECPRLIENIKKGTFEGDDGADEELTEEEQNELIAIIQLRAEIARTLIEDKDVDGNPTFAFDAVTAQERMSGNYKMASTTNPRTFAKWLNTVFDVQGAIDSWNSYCNPEKFEDVKALLNKNKDKLDKAYYALIGGVPNDPDKEGLDIGSEDADIDVLKENPFVSMPDIDTSEWESV